MSLLAVAAVVGLLFVPTPTPVRDALPFSSVQNVRRKASGLHLDVLVKGGTKPVERLLEGDELAAGDRLRFEVSSPAPGFVGVIGIDGTGTVSALAPPKGWLYALTTSDKILLPDAVVLDNAAGAESLLLFLCEERQEIETLTVALRRNLDVAPFGCRTTRVNFNKRVGL
ncbi:MAG: hypothetical protein SF187_06825 [Deltaproteobacteria bacterium]|nr:hypothetical protein [Deltaproteobacteria bacterium]